MLPIYTRIYAGRLYNVIIRDLLYDESPIPLQDEEEDTTIIRHPIARSYLYNMYIILFIIIKKFACSVTCRGVMYTL